MLVDIVNPILWFLNRVLDDGKSFGEMALMNNKPRGATILCKQDTHFAVMDREDFRGTLMKLEEKVQDMYIDFLSMKLSLIK